MRLWWYRWKSRRNRWLLKAWDRWAVRREATEWVDHYYQPVEATDGARRLYVEVIYTKCRYGFGGDLGMRLTLEMTVLTVAEHCLSNRLQWNKYRHRYFGLKKAELLSLFRQELPWLTDLPTGNAGTSRTCDRRPPKRIE